MEMTRNNVIIQQPQPRLVFKGDVATQLLRRCSGQSLEFTKDTRNLTLQSPTSSTHMPPLPETYRDVSDDSNQHPSKAKATARENIDDAKQQGNHPFHVQAQPGQLQSGVALTELTPDHDDACDSGSDSSSSLLSDQTRADVGARLRQMRAHVDLADQIWSQLQAPFHVMTSCGDIRLELHSMSISVVSTQSSEHRIQTSEQVIAARDVA